MNTPNWEPHPILKYERNDCYPYIVLPAPISLQLREPKLPPPPRKPEPPQLPPRPVEPRLPELPTPVMDNLRAALSTGAGVSVSIALIIALIIGEAPGFLILAGMAGVATLARFLYESWTYEERIEEYERKMRSYPQEQKRYEERLALWKGECNRIESDYKQRVEEQSREYQNRIAQIIRNWENGLIFQPLDLRQPFLGQGARAGRYDHRLREALIKKLESLNFSTKFLPEQASLKLPGFDFPYTPDVAIQVSINNRTLLIDVEIDEPCYETDGRRIPYHTLDDCKQSQRDAFFRDSGWIVVRFSERQVAMEIEKCTNFTYYLIQAVLMPGFRDPSLSLPSDHRRWDSLSALDEERSFFT